MKINKNIINKILKDDLGFGKDLCTALDLENIVFFDLEMSGLSPSIHEIIEIGAIKFNKSGSFEVFEEYSRPKTKLTKENIAIHGITNNDLNESRPINEVLIDFISFIANSGVVAYNVQFDISFLIFEAQKYKLKLGEIKVFDTFKLIKNLAKATGFETESFKLSNLVKVLGIDLSSHRALDDSLACYLVTKHFCQLAREKNLKFDLKNLKDFYQFTTNPKDKENDIFNKFPLMIEALKNNENLKISYSGGSKGKSFRPIKPMALLPLPTGAGVYALCLKDKLPKFFWLKKIKDVQAC